MIATRFKDFNDEELVLLGSGLDRLVEQSGSDSVIKKLADEAWTERQHRDAGIAEYRDVESYYFGCVRQAGHYWWKPGRYSTQKLSWRHNESLTPWESVDGTLAPGKGEGQLQGKSKLHHKDGWTAFAFWDRSVDTRGGSSSTFFFKAPDLDFNIALALARLTYPDIFERYTFEIVEDR